MNLYKKERPTDRPYEVWKSFDGQWEWRVYKKKGAQHPGDIWYCGVQSPSTMGRWEYGDVSKETIIAQAVRTYIDPEVDFFSGVRPDPAGTNIVLPDVTQSGTLLPSETFPFLTSYFSQNGMSYHTADAQGNISFLLSLDLTECSTVVNAEWGFSFENNPASKFVYSTVVYDDLDDSLHIQFVFNATSSLHRYELVRLVEQENLTFYCLTQYQANLYFVTARTVSISDDIRNSLAVAVRNVLLNTNPDVGG